MNKYGAVIFAILFKGNIELDKTKDKLNIDHIGGGGGSGRRLTFPPDQLFLEPRILPSSFVMTSLF